MVAMRIALAFLVSLFGVGCADLQLIQLTAHAGACTTCFTVQVEVKKGLWGLGALKTVDEHKAYASGKLAGAISAVQARAGGTVTGKVGTAPGSGGTDEAHMYILVDGVALSSVGAGTKTLIEADIQALGSGDAQAWNLAVLGFVYASGDTSAGLTSDQAASGKGDPHLTNMHGQRFDLYQPGVHVLIQVPRHSKPADALLRVEADARRMGAACADLYFQILNITGSWTGGSEGLQFFANQEPDSSDWRKFGEVDLKVIRGHTDEGIAYLNVFVKHLSAVKLPVGGLLGEDDHAAAATPGPECAKGVDLHAQGASYAMIEG